jgi:hypothetical protein
MGKKELLIRCFKGQPCADCGGSFPYYVMHPDHRPGETKLFNISDASDMRGKSSYNHLNSKGPNSSEWSIEDLRLELAKCEPVCSNCHAVRTHKRGRAHVDGRCGCNR